MSKIGRKPIVIPSGIQVTVKDDVVTIKGPKGTLETNIPAGIRLITSDNTIFVKKSPDLQNVSIYGLTRAMIQNMVTGVSKGFEKRLELIGVGYRAQASGRKVSMNLGFSHTIEYVAPDGVTIQSDAENKNLIIISGIDRQKVGQVASDLRVFRPPEPYKGKGIHYYGEKVARKAGKAAVGATGGAAA